MHATCTCTCQHTPSHVQTNTSMFEAACSDRIQQFDDEDESEDEEDEYDSGTWSNKDANLASPMEHRRWVWLYMPSGTVVLELYVCGCVSDS